MTLENPQSWHLPTKQTSPCLFGRLESLRSFRIRRLASLRRLPRLPPPHHHQLVNFPPFSRHLPHQRHSWRSRLWQMRFRLVSPCPFFLPLPPYHPSPRHLGRMWFRLASPCPPRPLPCEWGALRVCPHSPDGPPPEPLFDGLRRALP